MPPTRQPAPTASVARVLPLLGVGHLDRVFEYRIDSQQDAWAQPGVRVRIRFGNRLVDGILLERTSTPEHTGKLNWLDRVISPEVVYPDFLKRLIDSLAQRYAGITSDLIRSAIPSRHAKAEESDTTSSWFDLGQVKEPDLSYWSSYNFGESFVDAVLAGSTARAAWQFAPGEHWAAALAALCVKVVLEGGGALVVLPDQRDVNLLEQAFRELVSAKQITVLTSALGPQARYRRYRSVLHGQAQLVIGTRSAAFAPMRNLRLAVIKDDGDDNLIDPRAPYVHAREVLTTRSSQQKCSLIMCGNTRTAEVQLLVDSGWAHNLVAPRETIRTRMPHIRATGDSDHALQRDPLARQSRLPAVAYQTIRSALDRGEPVLVQVPRKGYIPTLACKNCGSPARCRYCNGPLSIPVQPENAPYKEAKDEAARSSYHKQREQSGYIQNSNQQPWQAGVPTCRWCGRADNHFRCGVCGSTGLRAVVLGQQRTAEEFGRSFPKVRVITSGGNRVIDSITADPTIVISTPGSEPLVEKGKYGAAILLDTWALLGRQDLRAVEDTFAKWVHAASLVASHYKNGEVVVVADSSLPVVQFLIRWDVIAAAQRELQERQEVLFPPAVSMAAVDGAAAAISQFLDLVQLPADSQVLGPVDLPPGVSLPGHYDEQKFGAPQRILIRAPLGAMRELGQALRAANTARTVRKEAVALRIQVDPHRVG